MLAWIPAFPLIGFLINGLYYFFAQTKEGQKKANSTLTGAIASFFIFLSFVFSLVYFIEIYGLPEEQRSIVQNVFNWFQVGSLSVDFALRFDALSSLFCLVITGVGTLIHVYSIGYMSHDESPGKFFAYLNLFCFAMLVLVLGDSLPVMFLGWEGVGLCSYLLIGFWYQDTEKASAGKKAFIVNRVGDLGFLIGLFLIFTSFGTVNFLEIQNQVNQGGLPSAEIITAICLFLFVGCAGKSAQIPLYVWLPDAMAGPTPVSALIHAATMVTSGIYLLSRLSFLFIHSPDALMVIAWVGGLTALFAGTMAIAQKDIKKVLAYSTVSQLGYMFLACGVGAFSAGVFHVITHAFFKALLFLGAGSVIYGLHHEQDLMKMGGLKSKMPHTFITMAAGYVAICGLPPFSGFFSKDEILWHTFGSSIGSKALWVIAAITAVLTALYMTRMFSLCFFGKTRAHEDPKHPIHESPKVMTVPLMILAVLSVLGGFIGIPHISWLHHWLETTLVSAPLAHDVSHSTEWVLMGVSTVLAVATVYFGLKLFANLKQTEAIKQKWIKIYRVLENKWYVDELYEMTIVKPIAAASRFLWKVIDVSVIDKIVVGVGRISEWTGSTFRVLQTGSLQFYVLFLAVGVLMTLGFLFYGLV